MLWLVTLASATEPDAEITVVAERDPRPDPGTTEVRIDDVARPGDGLEDVLATVPGARVRRLGGLGAFAGVSLRGTAFRQSLVRLDGVPLNPDGVEAVDLSRWPLAGLASVRVTPGRPPATVGAAPIGGVVDLVTRSGARFWRIEGARGSFGSTRGSAAAGSPFGGTVPGDVLVAGDVLDTAGRFAYPDDGGTRYDPDDDETRPRENNDRTQGAGLVRVRLGDDQGRATLLTSFAAREEGLPGPIGLPLDGPRLATRRGLVGLDGEGVVGAGRIAGGLWFLGRAERLDDPEGALPRVPGVQRFRTATVGARASGQGALLPDVTLRGSLDVRREGFDRRDGDARSAALTASRWGVGAAIDLPIDVGGDVLDVIPGLDARALVSVDPESETTLAALPGAVLRWTPHPAVALWASGGGGFRPPDLTELYGDRGAFVGDPDLRPERAWKSEIGARASRLGDVGLVAELSAYAVFARDAIGWLQNTQRTLVAVNFGRTRTLGGDLGAALSVDERVGIRASGSLTAAVQTTDDPARDGRPVPFVAPVGLWGRIWARPGLGLELAVDVDHTSAVPVDPQGIVRQPRRTLLGASVSWTACGWLTLSADVDNLLDARTGPVDRDPLGVDDALIQAPITDFVGYPLPGRTGWLSVRLHPPKEAS